MKINKAINALVQGLKDGGADFATNFPGFYSQDIFEALGGKDISINERVALENCYGASMAGVRSVVSFKSTGLNVASDVFFHSVLNGLEAGMVIVLTEDVECASSPERQDSRPFSDVYGGLWFEPSNLQEAYDFARESFLLSEQMDLPIVIRLTNQFFELSGDFLEKTKVPKYISSKINKNKYVSYWKQRDDALSDKNLRIKNYIEGLYPPETYSFKHEKGLVVVGNNQKELANYGKTNHDILKIVTYPIPENVIKSFVRGKKEIKVFEQGRGFVSSKIKALVSADINFVVETGFAPDRSSDWKVFNDHEKLFRGLSAVNPEFVAGDEGMFTDESTKSISVCLAMGASVGVAMGYALAKGGYPFCVIGDTSFTFGGKQALEEAFVKKVKFGVVVLDNNGAKSTGGQKQAGFLDFPYVESQTVDFESTSKEDFQQILSNMQSQGDLSILYVKTK